MWPFKKKEKEPIKTTGDWRTWELCTRKCVARHYGRKIHPWDKPCFVCGGEEWEVVVGRFHYVDGKEERFEGVEEVESK